MRVQKSFLKLISFNVDEYIIPNFNHQSCDILALIIKSACIVSLYKLLITDIDERVILSKIIFPDLSLIGPIF